MRKPSASLSTASVFIKRLHPQGWIAAIALFLFTFGAISLSQYGWRQSLLFLIGGLLGVTLYRASFGFASAYRRLLVQQQVQGINAQLIMLAIATLLFAPVLAQGSFWGQPVEGAIAPIGVPGAIGAFIFGVGMQLGGACGCGTLYTLGGSVTMLLTLVAFSIGAFWASLTRQLWAALPAHEPIVLGAAIGWPLAVVLQLILLGFLAIALRWWSLRGTAKQQQAALEIPVWDSGSGFWASLLRRPWPLWAGAIALAVLNELTLILSGQPWRITWGFALWAAHSAIALGWDSSSSPFWGSEPAQKVLSQGIFADVSSVMNLGIILGAMLAAALAGRLVAQRRFTLPLVIRRLGGGLIMGYGAFLAAGCNVSAFLGGIASTSLHGWVWIVSALAGSALGVWLLQPRSRLE
jgi:uncharacterized protein